MEFRERLMATLRAIRPVLAEETLVVGSEVPNLLQPAAAVPLVVSKDVDIGVLVSGHARVRDVLRGVRGFRRSTDEPSVLIPQGDLLEVNFVGIDPRLRDVSESYAIEDVELPLLVFGSLSVVLPGRERDIEGVRMRLPETGGLLAEKLLTERSGPKGDRDLLVALGLVLVAEPADERLLCELYRSFGPDCRYQMRSNLTILSLMEGLPGMPDPTGHRGAVARLLRTLEAEESSGPAT